jgi:hypothetical protein
MLLTYCPGGGGGVRIPSTAESALIGAAKMVFNFKWQTLTAHSAKTHPSVWLAFVSHEQVLRFFCPRPKITNHILLATQIATQKIAANLRQNIKSDLRIRFTIPPQPLDDFGEPRRVKTLSRPNCGSQPWIWESLQSACKNYTVELCVIANSFS